MSLNWEKKKQIKGRLRSLPFSGRYKADRVLPKGIPQGFHKDPSGPRFLQGLYKAPHISLENLPFGTHWGCFRGAEGNWRG